MVDDSITMYLPCVIRTKTNGSFDDSEKITQTAHPGRWAYIFWMVFDALKSYYIVFDFLVKVIFATAKSATRFSGIWKPLIYVD